MLAYNLPCGMHKQINLATLKRNPTQLMHFWILLGIFSNLGGTGRLIVFEIFGGLTSPNSYVTIRGN
jgi:hypothetical protein